jgi:hypothetical protein
VKSRVFVRNREMVKYKAARKSCIVVEAGELFGFGGHGRGATRKSGRNRILVCDVSVD